MSCKIRQIQQFKTYLTGIEHRQRLLGSRQKSENVQTIQNLQPLFKMQFSAADHDAQHNKKKMKVMEIACSSQKGQNFMYKCRQGCRVRAKGLAYFDKHLAGGMRGM